MDSIHSEYDMEEKKAADDLNNDLPKHNTSKIQRLLAKKPHKNKIHNQNIWQQENTLELHQQRLSATTTSNISVKKITLGQTLL